MGQRLAYRVCWIGAGIVVILLALLVGGCSSPASPGPTFSATATPTATPSPAATPSTPATTPVVPAATPSPSPSHAPAQDIIVQSYQWLYKGKLYQFQLTIPRPVAERYLDLPRSSGTNYATYAITGQDWPYVPRSVLKSAAQSQGFGEYDAAMLVQSFVESLNITPGRNVRPQFPVETILDKGGDSEDASILAAALLNDLGYDSVILVFPDHAAVGVKAVDELYGRYYTYNGGNYYYLETAIPGYGLGEVPDEYKDLQATIGPMSGNTAVTVNASAVQASEEALFVYFNVSCEVRNAGVATAKNVSVHFTALALIYGPDQEWPMSPRDVSVGDLGPGESRIVEATVKVPRSGDTQIECIASGDNFDAAIWKGEQFTL